MARNTIEVGFQYQSHFILRKFAKDYEVEKEFEEDAETAAWKYRKELGEYFVDALDQWVGAQDAYTEPY